LKLKGTDTIEVIIINLCNDKEVKWNGKAFKKMKNLKILIVRSARFSRGPKKLPNSLRVLDWSGYPSDSLPADFNPKNLMILSLPESCLISFKSLKVCFKTPSGRKRYLCFLLCSNLIMSFNFCFVGV
jgi:L1 cell adhesion molecule like protein